MEWKDKLPESVATVVEENVRARRGIAKNPKKQRHLTPVMHATARTADPSRLCSLTAQNKRRSTHSGSRRGSATSPVQKTATSPPVAGAITQEFIDLAAVLNALRMALPPGELSDIDHA